MSFRFLAVMAVAATAALASPASAQAMSVGTFLTRAAPLRANPLMALTSPDYAVLKNEAGTAVRQLRTDAAARKAAGKPPVACVPDGETLGIMAMLDGLDGLSAADKRLPLKDGYARVLAKRFPCH